MKFGKQYLRSKLLSLFVNGRHGFKMVPDLQDDIFLTAKYCCKLMTPSVIIF